MSKGLKTDCFDIYNRSFKGIAEYKRIYSLQEAINYVIDNMELPHIKKIIIKRKKDKKPEV